jgi:C-terminal processing protease CtpA/Prc
MRLLVGIRAAGAALWVAALVAGCGGGGGDPGKCSASAQTCAEANGGSSSPGSGTTTGTGTGTSPTPTPSAAIAPSSTWANICTADAEKQFTRSYLNEDYLWYKDMPALQPSQAATVPDYFYSLLTPQLDSHGQYKDRFSFIATSTDADSLLTGANVGYGVRWEQDDQNRLRVAYVEAGSPAALAGLQRGGVLVSLVTPNADWYPNGPSSITFVYSNAPGAASSTITLATAPVQEDPLPLTEALTTSGGRRVAYLLFNAHTEGAQDKLIPALQTAQAAGAQEVVLDMRYNGGGYLYTALSLSSMLAGPAADGQVFEQLRFNDKLSDLSQDNTFRFSGQVQFGESAFATGTALPRLNLPRVFVLATGSTCSASESVVNSLRGVGVDVVLIGGTTCGKPYGFQRADNCGWAYFAIEFQGVNAQGFGDYAQGFAPTCPLPDDFEHPLGSTSETLLSAAMHYVDTGSCPSVAMSAPLTSRAAFSSARGKLLRGKVLSNHP